MKRRVALLVSVILTCSTLSSCTLSKKGDEELQQLRGLASLEEESTVKDTGMSVTDKEAAIYAQVSNRTLMSLADLEKVSDAELQVVEDYMDRVNAQLSGEIRADSGVIDASYTDYLLMLFEKTPYYWQRSKMNVMGMDSASRSIIVDVTYSTIPYMKTVNTASKLALGTPDYDTLARVRYTHWQDILDYKYTTLGWDLDASADEIPEYIDTQSGQYLNYLEMVNDFNKAYGTPEEILASQVNLLPTDVVYQTGNQQTYTGLVDSEADNKNAELTVRFVLVPEYVMGLNNGYLCKHMYLLDYNIKDNPYTDVTPFDDTQAQSIENNVYEVLLSYFNALDEDNYTGLYKLSSNFGSLDKYYRDYFATTYRKHGSFTFTITNIVGTQVECIVDISEKERAKGSEMSLPIYSNTYHVVLDLVDKSLKISDITLLKSELKGEPAINADWLPTTGFNSTITLTGTDKQSIEDLIANFGVLQLAEDTKGKTFSEVVDTSISANQMTNLKSEMLSVAGDKKVVWLLAYTQGTSNYASARCKELISLNGRLKELTTVYSFLNKGGDWYISEYSVESCVQLSSGDLVTKNALCVCNSEEVEEMLYTTETRESDAIANSSTSSPNSVSYTYEVVYPTGRGHSMQLSEVVPEQITDTSIKSYLSNSGNLEEFNTLTGESLSSGQEVFDFILELPNSEIILSLYRDIIAIDRNYENGFLNREDFEYRRDGKIAALVSMLPEVEVVEDDESKSDESSGDSSKVDKNNSAAEKNTSKAEKNTSKTDKNSSKTDKESSKAD